MKPTSEDILIYQNHKPYTKQQLQIDLLKTIEEKVYPEKVQTKHINLLYRYDQHYQRVETDYKRTVSLLSLEEEINYYSNSEYVTLTYTTNALKGNSIGENPDSFKYLVEKIRNNIRSTKWINNLIMAGAYVIEFGSVMNRWHMHMTLFCKMEKEKINQLGGFTYNKWLIGQVGNWLKKVISRVIRHKGKEKRILEYRVNWIDKYNGQELNMVMVNGQMWQRNKVRGKLLYLAKKTVGLKEYLKDNVKTKLFGIFKNRNFFPDVLMESV